MVGALCGGEDDTRGDTRATAAAQAQVPLPVLCPQECLYAECGWRGGWGLGAAWGRDLQERGGPGAGAFVRPV